MRRATMPLATTMSTEPDRRFVISHETGSNLIILINQEGNSLTGVMGSYTGAAGNTVHYVADQWGFRLV